MKKWCWVFVLLFSSVHASPESDACKQEIVEIDKQVKKLTAEKQKYIDEASKYQASGDRWQYTTGRIETAHEEWGKANMARSKAIELELQIDELLQRKYRIYEFYPWLQYE
ncbi:MAG: hypothetical protein ABSA17_02205 [Rhabdochlamydiaceae bacterium]|jgi:hypothetical protein